MSEVNMNPPTQQLRSRGRLGRNIALVLLPLVLIPLIAMGAVAYFRTRVILQNLAAQELVSAAQGQVATITNWASLREQRLQIGSQRSALREPVAELIVEPGAASAIRDAQDQLTDLSSQQGIVLFNEMLIVRNEDALILAATAPDWIGQTFQPLTDGRLSTDSIQTLPIHADPTLSAEGLALVSAIPMRALSGVESDVLLIGVNSGIRLSALMSEIQAFWEERGVYVVERGGTFLAIDPNIIVQLARYETTVSVQSMAEHPVFDIVETTTSGTATYTGLDGTEVLGAFEWIPQWGMGVIIELPQAEVFQELATLAPFSIGLVAGAGVFSVLIVSLATNRMLQPLGQLTEFASRISRGEWQTRVPESRNDEIGELGQAFNRMAIDLSGMYHSLEERVDERTRQIRTASEVARAVTSTPSLEVLLQRAVELIRDRFDYYHASIFLIDGEGKNAVLAESTGEVGQAMKARGHSLPVGSQSIIGWVTANNAHRVALDVGEDPIHLANELLPETRSEAAVPLQVGGRMLGALDVQSTEPDAFREEDIEILQTLADQLSAAIQNAKLAATSVEAAERARMISDVTSQLSGMMEIERVLQTTAQALHRTLGGKEVIIQMASDGEPAEDSE